MEIRCCQLSATPPLAPLKGGFRCLHSAWEIIRAPNPISRTLVRRLPVCFVNIFWGIPMVIGAVALFFWMSGAVHVADETRLFHSNTDAPRPCRASFMAVLNKTLAPFTQSSHAVNS